MSKHKRTADDFRDDMKARIRINLVAGEIADKFNQMLPVDRKLSNTQKLFLAGLIMGAIERLRAAEHPLAPEGDI